MNQHSSEHALLLNALISVIFQAQNSSFIALRRPQSEKTRNINRIFFSEINVELYNVTIGEKLTTTHSLFLHQQNNPVKSKLATIMKTRRLHPTEADFFPQNLKTLALHITQIIRVESRQNHVRLKKEL